MATRAGLDIMKTRALRNRLKDARDDGDSSIRWYLHYQEFRELLPKATILVFLARTGAASLSHVSVNTTALLRIHWWTTVPDGT